MNTAITSDDLKRGFQVLGIQNGMTLEVHCSLSSFGWLVGGANALIQELMQAVGDCGSIVMPSFRLSPKLPLTDEDRYMGLTTKIRILETEEEHSAMGIVSVTFRKRDDVITGDGIFRVSAWGRNSQIHSRGLQHLIDNGGYALLLGVDIYSLSAMHYVEDGMPSEIRERFLPSKEARRKYHESQWLIESWVPDSKPWYRIQEEAYAKGLIADAYIGNAKCMFFQVFPVIDIYRKALLERPFELYGLT